MSVTRHAIEKNRVTLVSLLVLFLAGAWSYATMPRSEDPGFIIRNAVVITYFPGASPERVEQLVTDKLEKVIQEIPELDKVRSESKTGASLIFVDIKEEYRKMRPIWDDLRRKVDAARDELPTGIVGPIVNDEFGDVFGIIVSITGGQDDLSVGPGAEFDYRQLKDVADEVRDELLLIDEVAKIEIYGDQEERIFIDFNNARLADLGLSPVQLKNILESRNIIIPGGEIRTEFEEFALEPSGNFSRVDEIKDAMIQVPGRDDLLYLRDIADDIYRGYIDPPQTRMRASGTRSLGLAVSMRDGGNILTLGKRVRETLARVQGFYPVGIEFDVIQFQPDAVQKKVREFSGSLVQAVLIVAVVMLITLGVRTGLVVASLIPGAMLASFCVMSLLGVGLDQMSLASLIIALGMLVDNAIVMSESILVQMGEGKPAVTAAVDSAAELRIPLLISSLTTAAAFLPIFLAESTTGEYTAPLFKVVTITLMCSWVLSLTMIPLLCVSFLKVETQTGSSFDNRFYRMYRGALLWGLRHRLFSLAIVLLVFFGALQGFRLVPAIFFPPNDRPTFTAEIALPTGTPVTRTETVVREVEAFVRDELTVTEDRAEGVTNWAAFIGEGAPRFILPYAPELTRPDYAFILINASSREVVDEMAARLERFCLDHYPDVKATVRPLDLGPPAWPPIEVRISGRDPAKLFAIVDRVKEKLRETPGTKLIDDDWGARSKKLFVQLDQARARRAGVSNQDVAISLQTFVSGLEVTDFREDDKLIPVVLRSVGSERHDIDKLETLNVYAQASGQSVPLKQVADVQVVFQPSVIRRHDRLRTVTVEAGTAHGVTATDVTEQLFPWLDEEARSWGLGYSWEAGGEAETSGKAQASIIAKLPIAGLIIILLLVAQFNSLRLPAIILMTIPLSLIGVVIGLVVARSYFGFMTLLGIISLAGIVINNAIVLLDRIGLERQQNGLPADRAVIESAQRRLRPILLTTCTTAFGLLPLWWGGGPMFKPMAITIFFGLIFATGLTLGVVPVLYSLMFRVDFKEFRYD